MPTLEDRKFELKQKRSDALMAKINVLRARDGSVAPPIPSMKEEDAFNTGLLFGLSRTENINWTAMGVEGLIRCYYEIVYRLTGKIRNNIIVVGTTEGDANPVHNTSCRSGLSSAVGWLTEGQGYKSGFYCGWSGLEEQAQNESNTTTKQRLNNVLSKGRRGDFDVPMTEGWTTLTSQLGKPSSSSSFTDNRDGSPVDDRPASVLGKIDDLITLIGTESSIGPHILTIPYGGSPPPWSDYVNDTLLGKRHRDVASYQYTQPTSTTTTSGGGTDSEGNSIPSESTTTYQDGSVRHGDGSWDAPGQTPYPSGYTPTPDFWDSNYEVLATAIMSKLNEIITFINYTKITNFTYFVNHRVIPGIDPTYNPNSPGSNIGTSWSLQNSWISQINTIIDRIQQSLTLIAANKQSSTATKSASRAIVDNEIFTIKSLLINWLSTLSSLASTIDSPTTFGDVANPLSLYGHRFLWVRTLIHPTEGTMTTIGATGMAIDMMNKKLKKSEEELYMFGIMEEEFIPIPIIVGIEPYPVLNAATFEMEIGGWLVAWGGQEHCTGYDVWKSDDYDPATKTGRWTKIEVSNTQYTMSDINANNGRVLTYIIDSNVPRIPNDTDPALVTHPYYKIKAYDYNGGSGDYSRKNATSVECDPLNPAAFPFGGGEKGQIGGPRTTPVTITEDSDSTIPPNTLFWVTNLTGNDAEDFERRLFKSEAIFDSTSSNLIVFVDGKFKNKGLASVGGDYVLVDDHHIRFHSTIALDAEVNLVVALRSFAPVDTREKGSVGSIEDLDNLENVSNGDIYNVEGPPSSSWQWVDPPGEWQQVASPRGSTSWRDPVNTFSQLPTSLNADGDIRLVLDTSILFRWDGGKQVWAKISGSTGAGWLAPVDTTDDLEIIDESSLKNGAIVFVASEESLYRWNATLRTWNKIAGSNSASWKNPVNTLEQLPRTGNSEGDVRMVLSDNKMYRWDAWSQEWKITKSEADMAHKQLNDADWEVVDDHDVRYYPKEEVDTVNIQFEERLRLLESLKPKNAQPLSGDFEITGAQLYEGYLSEGTVLRYDTLRPGDYFRRIIKKANFIMSNTNTQQFKDADKGVLYCYINGIVVDEFNLASWFNEGQRETGQTYPPQSGVSNIIEIISVGPYNQYPSYQRADFKINIKEALLVQGENKIQLVHDVLNPTHDIHRTDEFIVFWDSFGGEMGFKEIYVDEVQLSSAKYISGVRYYSIGDKLRFRFMAENLFNNSYIKENQIRVGYDEFGVTQKYINYEDGNVLGQPVARIGENVSYLEDVVINLPGVYSTQPTLRLDATNPFKTYSQIKNNTNFLINTIISKSNDREEFFLDENYRLPPGNYLTTPANITGQWNSQAILTSTDLQVFGGRLIYPQQNFSSYKPSQTVNYSTAIGTRYYYRAFKSLTPHSNGKFTIGGFNKSDANIKIDIRLPGQTGWLSLNKTYNVATFTGIDGDGCLISSTGETYQWTSGEFSSANSNYMIIMRVTMYAKTNNLSSIKLDW